MSEIELYGTGQSAELATIEADTRAWELIARQADMLASSGIIPQVFQRNPASLMAAGLLGRRFGWDIITSAMNIEVVSGNPQLKVHALVGLIRARGHRINGEATNEAATVEGQRVDTGETMTVTFTMEDGRRAGVAANWGKYPADHLWAKAVRRLARRLFADVALNLAVDTDDEPPAATAPTTIASAVDQILAQPPAELDAVAERVEIPGQEALPVDASPSEDTTAGEDDWSISGWQQRCKAAGVTLAQLREHNRGLTTWGEVSRTDAQGRAHLLAWLADR